MNAFVSAEPVPSSSFVNITSLVSQLAAGSSINFVVAPIDAAGMFILDTSDQAYFSTLSHPESNTSVSCRVVFDTISAEQQGTCEIPALVCNADALCSPPVGYFVLEVPDSQAIVEQCPLNIKSCPALFYENDGKCVSCPNHVTCGVSSLISDWQLDAGYWRAHGESKDVQQCRFGTQSCPAQTDKDGNANCFNTKWGFCACGYTGPLCAECDASDANDRYYMAWSSRKCESCGNGANHAPTIALASGVFAFFLLVTAALGIKQNAITTTGIYQRIKKAYKVGRVKLNTVAFTCQARSNDSIILHLVRFKPILITSAGCFAIRICRDQRKCSSRSLVGRTSFISHHIRGGARVVKPRSCRIHSRAMRLSSDYVL